MATKAKDGTKTTANGAVDDELAAARAKREADEARNGADPEPAETAGEEDDGQLFIYEAGRKVTLGTLITRGTPIEYEVSMGSKSTKLGEQLIALEEKDVLVLARCVVGSYVLSAIRDGEDNVTKVKVRAHLKPKSVVNAHSEAGRMSLAG